MSKQVRQIDLPGCERKALRFTDMDCKNEAGQALSMCQKCQGSGFTCTAERTTYHKTTGDPKTETAAFPGSERQRYTRGGWTVTDTPCGPCKGAGLKVSGGSK